jgi:hypothetical protein
LWLQLVTNHKSRDCGNYYPRGWRLGRIIYPALSGRHSVFDHARQEASRFAPGPFKQIDVNRKERRLNTGRLEPAHRIWIERRQAIGNIGIGLDRTVGD